MTVSNKGVFIPFALCVFFVFGVEVYAFEGWGYLLGKVVLIAFSCYQIAAFFLKMGIVSAFGRMVSYNNENCIERLFYMILYGGVFIYLMLVSAMKLIG